MAGAVHGGEGDHVELRDDTVRDLAQPVDRGGVGGVVEGGDRLAPVVVAHGADEQVDSPGGRVRHGCQHLGRVQGRLAEVEQPDGGVVRGVSSGAHLPESTAWPGRLAAR